MFIFDIKGVRNGGYHRVIVYSCGTLVIHDLPFLISLATVR